ncbi:2-polyprenyl-6-methoxyphenol hydroxylase-like FAD-dependent oxidoreductase [Actinophytocola oryzae]|uniref:2-polyprenyl-6-methoxyphenol hydroxylase-like FAD-dependent oxidoreductase n=1 Tax=Actinophytocola oryzae TaxID=502181 RepID=A0A4R7W1X0_9PSEU|nr:2-polyprenyl-6-methoxyphenol hydroxylase-like FAD-dependent oxidoreductase [Actinophytocola oryzae]
MGAGLAGPLLAQGLVRAGFEVALYEREAAIDERSQGYRIHLDPEGVDALRDCLPPDLYDEVVATSGIPGSGVTILSPRLEVVQRIAAPVDGDEGPQHLSVDRVTLRRILLTGIKTGHATFDHYELLADGTVRVHFAGGGSAEADLLVGADGTHSRVRAQLLPDAEVVETGQFLIFGKTPLTPEARSLTPAASLDGFSVVAGADGRFMPLAGHRPRTGEPGYLMWVVGSRQPASAVDGSALRDTAARLVGDWHPDLAALVGLAHPATVHATTVRTAKPVPPWTTGPVTLIGDAVHTMVPAGIGAAVALRDAALLCAQVTSPASDLLDAVHAYEASMLEYGFAAVARSLRAGG